MSPTDKPLKLAFYGDDFTGSTDALDFLSRSGITTVLFIDPPDPSTLSGFRGLEAVGVAGMTRTMKPDEMRKVLTGAFRKLSALNPEFIHYKVCSTFDSSPTTGSIGTAIETGSELLGTPCVPVLVGAPALGRYCVFGNLFARMGTGPEGRIYRIDQHPSMSRHPATPARDGDLRDHLARQTSKTIGLLDVLDLNQPEEVCLELLQTRLAGRTEILFLDVLEETQLVRIGKLIHSLKQAGKPLFTVGSSGVEAALCRYWSRTGEREADIPSNSISFEGPVMVLSGSCSPVTARQIEEALENGFCELAIDVDGLFTSYPENRYLEKLAGQAARMLQSETSVILHTSRGPDDPRIQTRPPRNDDPPSTGDIIGESLGRLAMMILARVPIQRVGFAGGDSSSHAVRAMQITAVEMHAPFEPGAPLCRAHSPVSRIHGLQVNFKGGQVGSPDYFLKLRDGPGPSHQL